MMPLTSSILVQTEDSVKKTNSIMTTSICEKRAAQMDKVLKLEIDQQTEPVTSADIACQSKRLRQAPQAL